MPQTKASGKAEASSPEETAAVAVPKSGSGKVQKQQMEQKPYHLEVQTAIEEIPLPFTATVNVTLAILRKAPANSLMEVKPVGTLPLGTSVTITALHAGSARLKNGLWIRAEFLTPDFTKDAP